MIEICIWRNDREIPIDLSLREINIVLNYSDKDIEIYEAQGNILKAVIPLKKLNSLSIQEGKVE